jgi:hypothetical protein
LVDSDDPLRNSDDLLFFLTIALFGVFTMLAGLAIALRFLKVQCLALKEPIEFFQYALATGGVLLPLRHLHRKLGDELRLLLDDHHQLVYLARRGITMELYSSRVLERKSRVGFSLSSGGSSFVDINLQKDCCSFASILYRSQANFDF